MRAFIFDVAEYWIRFGIDGWRLDVPAEIDDDSFWQEFRSRIKAINPEAYIVGEIWEESQRWLQGDQFDAVINYQLTLSSLGFFTGKHLDLQVTRHVGGYRNRIRHLTGTEFAAQIDHVLNLYDPTINQVQLNLLDSHNTPRFLTSASGDLASFEMAMLFMFTCPGAPCIYYGDEIGLDGCQDPECRRSFPWDDSKWNNSLLKYTKACISLRHTHPALRRGSYQPLYSSEDVYVFLRRQDDETLFIAFNVGDQDYDLTFDVDALELPEGPLETIFGKSTASVQRGRFNVLKLATRSEVVFTKK